MAKKYLGISNVTRKRDVPNIKGLVKAQPRMNLYIKENLRVNRIFSKYTEERSILPYSIDESILNLTYTWHLFGKTPEEVALKIQKEVRETIGIYLTVDIGDSPVLAKLALDIEAKHSKNLTGIWHYEDVPEKLWPITKLNDVWSIGSRTAKKLNLIGINSMYDLAHQDPYEFRSKMGIIGEQLYGLSWGVDRSDITKRIKPKSKSYSNSQVLPRDYKTKEEICVVLKELADQVASRIRSHKKQVTLINLFVGYSYEECARQKSNGIKKQIRVSPTNDSKQLMDIVVKTFSNYWTGQIIRNVSLSYGGIVDDSGVQLNLFDSPEKSIKHRQSDRLIDEIRERFGTTALMRATSQEKGGTALARASLVSGHNGGNTYD